MNYSQPQYPQVNIPGLGNVQGLFDKDQLVAKFLNVPVGTIPERWRPAVPVKPWKGIHDATKPGLISPQQSKFSSGLSITSSMPKKIEFEGTMSEHDCLGCNIYMPACALGSSNSPLPVLAFVHGGGFKFGCNSAPLNDFTEFVKASIECNKPLIVVSLSYRTNYFGFFSSKELILDAQVHADKIPKSQRSWYDSSAGNWGLLDIAMGFQWVQDHIAAFSGDSEMITAMGQSAGSVSINNLLIIPQFHGLFRRAILQSGSSTLISAAHPEVEGQDIFDDLCQSLNIPADLDPLEKVSRLRNVPAKDIVEILDSNPIRFHRSMIDGVLLKQESYWASRDSRNYDRNIEWIMTGTSADEASLFLPMGAANVKEMDALKRRLCETNTESTFDSLYGTAKTNRDSVVISTTAIGDGAFFYPTLLTNEAVLSHPTCQLSRFYFDRNLDMVDKVARGGIGAFHGVEMFYIAGNEYAKKFMTEEEKGFIKDVQSVWIEFATARSPQESSLPIASKPILNDFLGISCQREQKEAIVFKKDLTVGRGDLERLTLEHAMFWWKSHSRFREYVAKGSYEAGFEYIRAGHGRPKSEVVRKVRVKSSNFVQESRL